MLGELRSVYPFLGWLCSPRPAASQVVQPSGRAGCLLLPSGLLLDPAQVLDIARMGPGEGSINVGRLAFGVAGLAGGHGPAVIELEPNLPAGATSSAPALGAIGESRGKLRRHRGVGAVVGPQSAVGRCQPRDGAVVCSPLLKPPRKRRRRGGLTRRPGRTGDGDGRTSAKGLCAGKGSCTPHWPPNSYRNR